MLQVVGSICFIFFLVSSVALAFREDFRAVPLLVDVLSSMPLLFLSLLSLRAPCQKFETDEHH